MTTRHDEMRWYAARRGLSAALYRLSKEVKSRNKKARPMSITGASHLSSSIRDMIAEAKARVTDAHSKIGGAVDNLAGAADAAVKIANAINAEADDLLASAGQFSNGGPPLVDPKPTPLPPAPTIAATPVPPSPDQTGEPKKNEGSL
jgi:hypothetical protein